MNAPFYEIIQKGPLQFYMPVFAPLTASEKNELRNVAATLPKHLATLLHRNHARVMDHFRALDSNSDGQVTQPELTKALKDLGVSASKDEIGKLFHQLDPDGSGGIEFRELQRAMLDEAKKEMDLGKNRPGLATLPQEPAAAPESTTSSSELPTQCRRHRLQGYGQAGRPRRLQACSKTSLPSSSRKSSVGWLSPSETRQQIYRRNDDTLAAYTEVADLAPSQIP